MCDSRSAMCVLVCQSDCLVGRSVCLVCACVSISTALCVHVCQSVPLCVCQSDCLVCACVAVGLPCVRPFVRMCDSVSVSALCVHV